MDVRMPELDGIEATRRLLAEVSGTKVVMLTTFDMDEYVYEALNAGASGFLLQGHAPEQLVAGIHAVASGDALLAPAITRRVIEEFVRRPPDSVRPAPPELAELTERESEVLKQLLAGSRTPRSPRSFVSETTVKTHVARVLMKLRLRDRVQAVVFAYESGLVQPGDAEGRPRERDGVDADAEAVACATRWRAGRGLAGDRAERRPQHLPGVASRSRACFRASRTSAACGSRTRSTTRARRSSGRGIASVPSTTGRSSRAAG